MKTFGNLNNRQAGILVALSSLPGNHGIGDLGQCAYDLIDLISTCGFKIWQMLPLNPSSAGNSPYTPYSSYACDEIYISLDLLVEDGLLKNVVSFNKGASRVDYKAVRKLKHEQLLLAFDKFDESSKDYQDFKQIAFWLESYARFMALQKKNDGKPWIEWDKEDQVQEDSKGLEEDMKYIYFVQYIFYKQFHQLKDYAHQKGISIMGDLPIYVGHDSADVFDNKKCFQLQKDFSAAFVSGASPDYFSKTGQLWNHPLYDWDYLKSTNYKFWYDRFRYNNDMFDIIRIDHFRAFDTYYSIPAGEKTAINGKWVEGPSYDFFDSIYKQIPNLNIVVEDLGMLRPQVHELRDHYNLMGMRIIQYAFGKNEAKVNYQLPKHCIAYTGTHDNAPIKGWYHDLDTKEKKHLKKIFKQWQYPERYLYQKAVHHTLASKADIAIIMIQDLLDYDNSTRLNLPGTESDDNWSWKLVNYKALSNKVNYIKRLIKITNR